MVRIKNWFRALNTHKSLILVLLLAVIVSVIFIELYENMKIWGDEPEYIMISHEEANNQISPVISLLPGYLSLQWWPPLPYSIYSFFANDRLQDHFAKKNILDDEHFLTNKRRFLKDVAYLQLLLLVVSGVLIYLISITMSLSPSFSSLAVALTIFNPRVLFYIQTLWPELIHYVLLLSAIFFFISYLKKNSLVLLLISSVLFIYCVFTKLIVSYYFFLLIVVLIYYHRNTLKQKRTINALCLFIIPFFLLSTIQKTKNYYEFNAFAISTNSWINIERGIIPNHIMDGSSIGEGYRAVSNDPIERERKSRERVIEYVLKSSKIEDFVSHQVGQFFDQLGSSFLQRGVRRNRWSRSNALDLAVSFSTFLSWFLFILGSVGAFLYSRKNIIIFSVAIFVIYYLASLFLVLYIPRYFVPVIPPLAIFTSMVIRDLIIASRKDPVI